MDPLPSHSEDGGCPHVERLEVDQVGAANAKGEEEAVGVARRTARAVVAVLVLVAEVEAARLNDDVLPY